MTDPLEGTIPSLCPDWNNCSEWPDLAREVAALRERVTELEAENREFRRHIMLTASADTTDESEGS